MALINNGFRIKYFSEHDRDLSTLHKRQEELDAKIPLSYILIGKKEYKESEVSAFRSCL